MIRVVKASTLDTLRTQALKAREFGAYLVSSDQQRRAAFDAFLRTEEARRQAEAARAEAEAKYDAVTADTAAALVRLWDLADTDPERLGAVQAGIALRLLRTRIAEIKASGDEELIDGIRVLDAVIGTCGRHAAAEALHALPDESHQAREGRPDRGSS